MKRGSWRSVRRARVTGCCLFAALMALILSVALPPACTFSASDGSGSKDRDAFVIQATRIEANGLLPTVVVGQDGQILLRLHIQEAKVTGLKLSDAESPAGGVWQLMIDSGGTVSLTGLTVDVETLSFHGVAPKLNVLVPTLVLTDVTMRCRQLQAGQVSIPGLTLTVSNQEQRNEETALLDLRALPRLPGLEEATQAVDALLTGVLSGQKGLGSSEQAGSATSPNSKPEKSVDSADTGTAAERLGSGGTGSTERPGISSATGESPAAQDPVGETAAPEKGPALVSGDNTGPPPELREGLRNNSSRAENVLEELTSSVRTLAPQSSPLPDRGGPSGSRVATAPGGKEGSLLDVLRFLLNTNGNLTSGSNRE